MLNLWFLILGDSSGCGVTDEVVEWMERVQNSAVPETSSSMSAQRAQNSSLRVAWQLDVESPGHKYSLEANLPTSSYWARRKRSVRPKEDTNNKNTCSLFIQTDPLIWRHIFEQVFINILIIFISCFVW